jgi:hypothetical protein
MDSIDVIRVIEDPQCIDDFEDIHESERFGDTGSIGDMESIDLI